MAEPSNCNRSLAAAASLARSFQMTPPRDQAPKLSTVPSGQQPYTDCVRNHLQQSDEKRGTVLYLAYGSNLSNETFRGNRGIKPLSQINVQVPSLRLTFDLPGIAYKEPCFANSARRDPKDDPPRLSPTGNDGGAYHDDEKASLFAQQPPSKRDKYRKDRWHKGLIGVVYEVTPSDYAHIIATEGGGSSYQDILVDCHPFASSDPTKPVPQNPTTAPFKAHTLFAPVLQPGEDPPDDGSGRLQRPDTSYAQPSARYLKLITDGAAELGLPYEYRDFLHSLCPYTITSWRQRVGQTLFLALWMPIVLMIFGLGRMFADDEGRQPKWLRDFTGLVFATAWKSYDVAYKRAFGDGERTVGDDGDDDDDEQTGRQSAGLVASEHFDVDVEKADASRY